MMTKAEERVIERIQQLRKALTWRLDVDSGEMIEEPQYTKYYLGFNRVSQDDLDWICKTCNKMFEDIESPLRIGNSMGELIPGKIKE